MKYILTLEKYRAYKDFENMRGKWGSPVDMRDDVEFCLGRLLPKDNLIKNIEDQSSDKGIKFFVQLKGGDHLHMYKVSDWQRSPEDGWEYYFNKKKMSYYDLYKMLEDEYQSKLEQFLKYFKSYDFYAQYIDDGRQWKAATANNDRLADRYKALSKSEQKKAKKEILKHFKSKELRPDVDRVFPG